VTADGRGIVTGVEADRHHQAARLREAERAAVFGTARVAAAFASDLAEALEAARVLGAALAAHVASHGDPNGRLGQALDEADRGLKRIRSRQA
jgi:hypothetical protein